VQNGLSDLSLISSCLQVDRKHASTAVARARKAIKKEKQRLKNIERGLWAR